MAVVEFLPPIEAGVAQDEFITRLETEIEEATDLLLAEAGFRA